MQYSPLVAFAVVLLFVSCTHGQGASVDKQEYSLDLNVIRETSKRLRVVWFITWGDLKNIKRFQVMLNSPRGDKLYQLHRRHRSIGLSDIDPFIDHTVILMAMDSSGNVLAHKQVSLEPLTPKELSSGLQATPSLFLEVNEMRSKQLRLAWALENVNPETVKNIRLYVERQTTRIPQVIERLLTPDKRTFLFKSFPANSIFCVTVEVIGMDDQPFLNSALTFQAPPEGQYGIPVLGSPLPPASLLDSCCDKCRLPLIPVFNPV